MQQQQKKLNFLQVLRFYILVLHLLACIWKIVFGILPEMKIIFWCVTTFAWFKTIKFLASLRFLHQNNAILCYHRTLCIIKLQKRTWLMRESAIFMRKHDKTVKSSQAKLYTLRNTPKIIFHLFVLIIFSDRVLDLEKFLNQNFSCFFVLSLKTAKSNWRMVTQLEGWMAHENVSV